MMFKIPFHCDVSHVVIVGHTQEKDTFTAVYYIPCFSQKEAERLRDVYTDNFFINEQEVFIVQCQVELE